MPRKFSQVKENILYVALPRQCDKFFGMYSEFFGPEVRELL